MMRNEWYVMRILGRNGMYTCGDRAATPDLARLAVGALIRGTTDRLAIYACEWVETGNDDPRFARRVESVLVEVESAPGEWTIGPRA